MHEFIASATLNAALIMADGTFFLGSGVGCPGEVTGEICFNTAMTGYQEVLTDPSYTGQIITFTYPHIGNTGCNAYDNESVPDQTDDKANKKSDKTVSLGASGLIIRNPISFNSNYRSNTGLNDWLIQRGITGICGIDTRALTRYIRTHGVQNACIVFVAEQQRISIQSIIQRISRLPTLSGQDLAKQVTHTQGLQHQPAGGLFDLTNESYTATPAGQYKVVAIDFGIKKNILHAMASVGLDVITLPATADFAEIMQHQPDGVFLSNGPGDPLATATYAVPVIQQLLQQHIPVFGICLGHQLLCLASGIPTVRMAQGHRGANHPVKNLHTGKVEITSQNHGFCADAKEIPPYVEVTHISLFDQGIEGIKRLDTPAFSVQYHPESSPGPHDSLYLFTDFVHLIVTAKKTA